MKKLVNGVLEEMTPEEIAQVEADTNAPKPVDPVALLTAAIKALPVDKRTNAEWGGFIGQCLLALEHQDMEALAYLLNTFQTSDQAYLTIIGQAKQLFGLA